MSDELFSLHHLPGYLAVLYIGAKEMFAFLAKVWPKNGNGKSASIELKLGSIVRAEVEPLRDDIKNVADKLDKHIQWHLEKGA